MKILEVQRFQRVIPNSCVAVACQSAAFYLGHLLKPQEAVDLVNCYPDGVCLKEAAEKLRKLKIKHRWLGTVKKITNWIDKGFPVLSGDDGLYFGHHAVLIIGYDQDNFYLADSNRADIRKVNQERLFNNSDEFYGLFK